jgi:hypothetical protein
MLGQRRDVIGAFPQWRQAQGQDGQPMIQILPEPARAEGGL